VVYAPDNPSSPSGSGLPGCGADKITGIAWPSNVIEAMAEGSQRLHSAPFRRALVEFFVVAFSDARDIVYDPFTGTGTSIAAAHILVRVGYGIELSPAYCDVALRWMPSSDSTSRRSSRSLTQTCATNCPYDRRNHSISLGEVERIGI